MDQPTERLCKECGEVKSIFGFSGKWIEGKRIPWRWKGAHYCKDCMGIRSKDHYYSDKNTVNLGNRKILNRNKIYDYLIANPCVDCGEKNPVVLEFDHVRGKKSFNISSAMAKGYTWDLIEEEIKKCDIRCANCHKIKTAKENSWSMYLWHLERTVV